MTSYLSHIECDWLQVIITVLDRNDVPPVFQSYPQALLVSASASPGTTITVVRAMDPDEIGVLRYWIVAGVGDGAIGINSSSGTMGPVFLCGFSVLSKYFLFI